MHTCHSVSNACRPAETHRRRGEIGSVQKSILLGQILCPTVVEGLFSMIDEALFIVSKFKNIEQNTDTYVYSISIPLEVSERVS